jgi:hypothetical protein
VAAPDWWDPNEEGLCVIGAYQARGAASYAASLVNRPNPGVNDLIEGNGVVPWDAVNSWGFVTVAAQWLDTGFIPQNDQSQSMLVQFANVVGSGTLYLAAARTAGGRIFALLPATAGGRVAYENGGASSVLPNLVAGNLGVAGNRGYRNGITEGGNIPGWAGSSFRQVFIGCRNNQGVADAFVTANIYAVVVYDCVLTAPQMLTVATAMAAL